MLPPSGSRGGETRGVTLRESSAEYGKLVIAGGPDKREAILGAMRGRYNNVQVTDEDTATALLT
ncbi:MAG: hypothetical protein HY359_05425 [Candidatus Rokubacteria bacterium]|nr:hypothetical protein [Candidatus Rokubacteria bacterium]